MDIEQPIAPQHEMFREDGKTSLPKKISGRNQKQLKKDAEATEEKRKAKLQTGKKTGGKANPRQVRRMTLKNVNKKGTEVSSRDG